METKRRAFLKTLGLGSGAMLLPAGTILAQDTPNNETQGNSIGQGVFKTKKYTADVVIAGGGMSGICAAIAAARNGATVIFIQDRSRLGGNASSEIRMHISGATILEKGWRETGILEEIFLVNSVDNPQRSYEMWDFILYDKVISEKNLTLLLDTTVCDAEIADGKITKVIAICSPTQERSEITAKYFADCTGDGTLAALAGAEFMIGREARSLWGESLAIDVADTKSMGNSILFMAQKHERKMPYTPPKWARKFTAKDFVYRKIISIEYGYWWLELGGLEDSIRDGQKNRHDLLSVLFGVWDYIKNSGNHPEAENWALSWIGMLPGKRESRRLVGDYIMKQEDIQKPKLFADRVAYGGWPIDDHPPEGFNGANMKPTRAIYVKEPYSIPFRSLYSKNISNLLMAGRNISASHVALSSTRVMATCAIMGQAVGTAMAYCISNDILPRILGNDTSKISDFQQLLLRQDQAILGIQNTDEKDLARKAKVKASSETKDGAAVQVIDGYNRDVRDGSKHQWRAEMKNGQQWIELSWDKPVKLDTVQLTFDTGLNRFLRISGQDIVQADQIVGPQPETVASYLVECIRNGKHSVLAEVTDNYLRYVTHKVKPIEADAIRITVRKTNGDELARIFEVRCYLEST
ncbi:FAD-dependent oxidoreductase [Pedobacter africanus]|uniref:Uncharacterized protein n=1 Tax=Pedobacter africanus TaxID=151894 RepID=A0ACC6KRU4_9SPHI|nr:FAD-dependent oxidoreductase [Pedobacter africanus]MDR6781984.1 hypothetical protein [Pedobacter africanus]